jgi:hypothetical protein
MGGQQSLSFLQASSRFAQVFTGGGVHVPTGSMFSTSVGK